MNVRRTGVEKRERDGEKIEKEREGDRERQGNGVSVWVQPKQWNRVVPSESTHTEI